MIGRWRFGLCMAGCALLTGLPGGGVLAQEPAGAASAPATQPTVPSALGPARPDLSSDDIAGILREDVRTPTIAPSVPLRGVRVHREPQSGPFAGTDNRLSTPLLREGMILRRRGRILRDERGYRLSMERDGPMVQVPDIRLLPGQVLEQALAVSGGRDTVPFDVAGSVTVFQGENYLLLLEASRVANLGNLE